MQRSTGSQLSNIDKETVTETTVNLEDISGNNRKPWYKRRKRWQKPLNIEIVVVDPIPAHNCEILKEIIKKAKLRRQIILHRMNTIPQAQIRVPTWAKKHQQHVIHKAIAWNKLLENGTFKSKSDSAKKEGLTRARVTQIMNLLRLPLEWRHFLKQLDDSKEIRKYSERKLRSYNPNKFICNLRPTKKRACR